MLFAFLIVAQWAIGQNRDRLLYGKILSDTTALENVNIYNSRTQITVATTKKGEFNLNVQADDLLIISAVNLETKRKYIRAEDLKGEIVIIKMTVLINNLKEVIVNDNADVNAVNLRIVPTDQKHYTPAQRKVYTATTGLLDPLLNKMSGRTTMLKKEVIVEHNEKLLLKLDGLYEDKYYTDVLKIPQDQIRGFQYYIVEDRDFAAALESKNKTLTMFYIRKLAVDYIDILARENQN